MRTEDFSPRRLFESAVSFVEEQTDAMDGETPTFRVQFLEVIKDDRGDSVILASSLFMILSGLVVVVTLASRFKILKTLIPSDWFLIGATVCSYPKNDASEGVSDVSRTLCIASISCPMHMHQSSMQTRPWEASGGAW